MAESNYWGRPLGSRLSRRALIRAGGVTGAGLALAGCGGGSNTSKSTNSGASSGSSNTGNVASQTVVATSSAQPKQGGAIVLGTTNSSQYKQADMHTALAASIWHLIGKRAIVLDGNTKKLLPATVEKWEIPGDGSEFILHVAPNVKIHDKPPANGRNFTAEDLAFNINRIAGKLDPQHIELYQRRSTMANLDHAEAIDQTTCKVVMTKPTSTFLAGLTEIRNQLMPKDVVEANLFNNIVSLAGHGPFMTKDYQEGQKMTATRHPNYFVPGEPHADEFQTLFLPDQATYLSAFLSGKIDMYNPTSAQDVQTVKAAKPDAKYFVWPSLNWYHIRFQLEKQPFTDFRVRRAIFLAMDYKEIADGTWGNEWQYTGPLEPEHPEALTVDQIKQLPGYNPSTKDKDRQDAKQLMTAAGYPDGEVTFQILPGLPQPTSAYYANAIRVQDQLKKVWPKMNVTVTPPADNAAFASLQAASNFSTVSYTITTLPDAVLEFASQWHSPSGTLGSRNYGKFKNDDADALIDKAFTTLDNEARKSILLDFQKRYFAEWLPAIQLHESPDRYFISPKLSGFDRVTGSWWYTTYREEDRAGVYWKT
ncbi:MAG: ABC transporter substrate-binding protein [Dehalococcoidia bacterium]